MGKFKILDVSGDIGLSASGGDIKEAFINAATGMYSLITDLDAIKEKKAIEVSAESESISGLLVSWLNELIFHFDAYGFVGKRLDITEFTCEQTNPKLKATISGEEFNPEFHQRRLLIKAATYHRLRVENIGNTWEIDVIFDI